MLISRLLPNLRTLRFVSYNYINGRELDTHLEGMQTDTTWKKTKYYVSEIRFIMKQAMHDIKDDMKWFSANRNQKNLVGREDLERYLRIKKDFGKLAAPMILNFLPFGTLWLVLFIKYAPQSLPSWIQVDTDEIVRQQAYQLVKQKVNSEYDISQFDYKNASMQQLKILSLALTGRVVDGTVLLNRIFKTKIQFDFFPMSHFSQFLIRRHVRKYLQRDIQFHDQPQATLQERIDHKIKKQNL